MFKSKPKSSNPAKLKLSKDLWRQIEPEKFGFAAMAKDFMIASSGKHTGYTGLSQALHIGDVDAGWVVSVKRPIVAAYSIELDAVVLLEMDKNWPGVASWKRGQRILVVNVYPLDGRSDPRIPPGPNSHDRFRDFNPIVPALICSDSKRIDSLMRSIPESIWQRSLEHAKLATSVESPYIRDGRPSLAVVGFAM